MVQTILGPDHDLAKRLSKLERDVATLSTRDVLQNASIGIGGIHIVAGGNLTVDGGGTIILNGVSLAGLIGAAVIPAVGSASVLSYTLTTSYATYASFNFTVPSGYTRALIFATGAITSLSQASGSEVGYTRLLIAGSAGTEGRAFYSASTNGPSIPASASSSLSGLTPGQTITIAIQSRLNTGPGLSASAYASASVAGQAIFLP